VNSQELFIIPFKGLSVGTHLFEWTIDKGFFTAYEMSEIDHADINVQVTLIKHDQFLEIDFLLEGWAEVPCDRCLDPLSLDIKTEAKLYVKFGDASSGEEDPGDGHDVIILPPDEDKLNVAQYLYEYAHLGLPIKRVHPDDSSGKSMCNEDMISHLEKYLVKEKNNPDIDPRWNDLKNIFDN
jgi:uncharacterized metal-binding protein YceD (DUF177 family)